MKKLPFNELAVGILALAMMLPVLFGLCCSENPAANDPNSSVIIRVPRDATICDYVWIEGNGIIVGIVPYNCIDTLAMVAGETYVARWRIRCTDTQIQDSAFVASEGLTILIK